MQNIEASINDALARARRAAESAKTAQALNVAYHEFLGRQGVLRALLRAVGELPSAERPRVGKAVHIVVAQAEELFSEKLRALEDLEERHALEHERIDISIPAKHIRRGRLSLLTRTLREVKRIFADMGFSVATGPSIEDAWHNFDALNIPEDHPARDLWDTLWLREEKDSLLRTHTSPVQIRYMLKHEAPFRIISPGSVYRFEATDATHEVDFLQVEGLMVSHRDDPDPVSTSHFLWMIEQFYGHFFKQKVTTRLRPSYFPFTEPSFEVDLLCLFCKGKGCPSCGHSGWLEMMGAGMVHPNVFRAVKYNPKDVQGFAFGMGLERLCMMRYRIPDVRLFRSGNISFFKQS